MTRPKRNNTTPPAESVRPTDGGPHPTPLDLAGGYTGDATLPTMPLDLIPTEIEQPKTNVLEATSTYVKPIKTSGKIVYSADKVSIEKNGKIIAMAVDRNIAESLVQNNPNLKIINNG